MSSLAYFSLLLLPLVTSLQCYTHRSSTDADLTNVQKTSMDCPITSRFCVSSMQPTVGVDGRSSVMETRGCADDLMCEQFIRSQSTECRGRSIGRTCCCMGDHCNERVN